MKPATYPREPREGARMLVLGPDGKIEDDRIEQLASYLHPTDLLVVNDAATLPASLLARTPEGKLVEVRLASHQQGVDWQVVLFGDGDWRTPTEHRSAPPLVMVGDVLRFERAGKVAVLSGTVVAVSELSPRLLTLRFSPENEGFWSALYALGVPIQYAYMNEPLALWSVQTAFAGRPFAVELPSAGRPLSFRALQSLRERGAGVAAVTHAAGLSSTGDPRIDEALPLPERFEVPASTLQAIIDTRRRGGSVIAVGTSVVRALEASASMAGRDLPTVGQGVATLRIGPSYPLRVVDGLLTGMHTSGESHYDLLGAFADDGALARATVHAEARGYLCHEQGDSTLILPTRRNARRVGVAPGCLPREKARRRAAALR